MPISTVRMPVALDTISLLLFAALYVVSAMLVMRRPIYGAALLLALGPFELARTVAGTEITLSKVALAGVVTGLIAWWPQVRDALHDARAVLLSASLVAVVTALTFVSAEHHGAVVRETFKALEHVFLIAAALACVALDDDRNVLLRAFFAGAAVVAVSALALAVLAPASNVIIHGHAIARLSGVLEGPNQLGAYGAFVVAVTAATLARTNLRHAPVLLAVVSLAIVATFSRGAAVAAAAAAVTVAACVPEARTRIAIGCSPLLLALGIAFVRTGDRAVDSGGVGSRGELWRAAFAMFRSKPLLGIGAGNYELRLANFGVYGVRTHANNWYLQQLAEGGVALLAATIAFIVTVLRALVREARSAPIWQLAALASMVAMLVHGCFDDVLFFQKVGTPFYTILGCGVGAALRARRTRDT